MTKAACSAGRDARRSSLGTQTSSPSRTQSTQTPGRLSFPIVGIGASAGGLDAFKRFFSTMPSDSHMGG
jgi:two-component system CheB/CheR fusion protein